MEFKLVTNKDGFAMLENGDVEPLFGKESAIKSVAVTFTVDSPTKCTDNVAHIRMTTVEARAFAENLIVLVHQLENE